jgi:hypothetical protein
MYKKKGYHLEAQPICILDQVRMSSYDIVTIRVPHVFTMEKRSAKEKCEGGMRR